MNILQIYIDYGLHLQLTGIIGKIYVYGKNFNHVWLGTFLFCSLKWLFERIPFNTKVKKVLDVADYYSYEIYLVHQFIILGPFSLLGVSPFFVANLMIVFASVLVLAWVVKKAEKFIQHYGPNKVVS
jgi:membrane-bound acyltransferase YfiQ involved in biofilm formation